jgi:hypothetical protein
LSWRPASCSPWVRIGCGLTTSTLRAVRKNRPTALLRYSSNAFHRFLLTWRCACSPGSLVTAQTRGAAAVLLQCQPMTQEGMCLRAGYYLLVQPCFSANRTGLVHCRMTDSDPPDVLISHCGNAPG